MVNRLQKSNEFSLFINEPHFPIQVLPILREVICRGIIRETPVSAEDESASQSAIKCFSSWIQHGVGVGLEESIHLTEPLLAAARNPSLTETSMDALTHLVNHPEAHRYPSLLMGMLNQLLSLQDYLQLLRYFTIPDDHVGIDIKNKAVNL